MRRQRRGVHRHHHIGAAGPGGVFGQRGLPQRRRTRRGGHPLRGLPQAGQAGGHHPPQRGAGGTPGGALLQPLLRGRPQKGGGQAGALRPHCGGGCQTVRPGHPARGQPAAAGFCGGLRGREGLRPDPLFLRVRRQPAAHAADAGQGCAPHRPHHRQRGRLLPRGSGTGCPGRGKDGGAGPPHPAVRDGAPGRTGRRHDADGQSGMSRNSVRILCGFKEKRDGKANLRRSAGLRQTGVF